jgi:hypothetical protein
MQNTAETPRRDSCPETYAERTSESTKLQFEPWRSLQPTPTTPAADLRRRRSTRRRERRDARQIGNESAPLPQRLLEPMKRSTNGGTITDGARRPGNLPTLVISRIRRSTPTKSGKIARSAAIKPPSCFWSTGLPVKVSPVQFLPNLTPAPEQTPLRRGRIWRTKATDAVVDLASPAASWHTELADPADPQADEAISSPTMPNAPPRWGLSHGTFILAGVASTTTAPPVDKITLTLPTLYTPHDC